MTPPSPPDLGESAHDHGNCQLCDHLDTVRAALAVERDDALERNQGIVDERNRLRAQVRAYVDTVLLKPHEWRALRDADPVPMPTTESLAAMLDDRTALQARLAAVDLERADAERVLLEVRGLYEATLEQLSERCDHRPCHARIEQLEQALAARPTPEPATCTECGLRYATVCRQCSEACCEDQP